MAKTNAPPLTEEELTEAVDLAFTEPVPEPEPEPVSETPIAEEDPLALLLNRIEGSFDARFQQMERRMELLALKAVEVAMPQAVQSATAAAAAIAANKPPMTLRANVYDNFIGVPGKVPHLGHYRCERMRAVKIQEYDMVRVRAYQTGEREWPTDKVGRQISLQQLTMIQGSYIPALDGHIYPITQNQVDCLEWYKTLPREAGGMPDLYKDDSIEPFRCTVCQQSTDLWPTREGWAAHMLHVHGEVVAAA
jgi:hypothetical protein